MDARTFYQEYFADLKIKEPEVEKQIARIERLRRQIGALHSPLRGLFVGIGRGVEMKTGRGKLVGLDLPLGQLARLRQEDCRNLYVSGDARSLPFENDLFDYVVCSEVIEHIEERSLVLQQLSRVLNANGTLILSTPNWWSLYGLFRKLYELVSKRAFHADDQPIDEWTTPSALAEELTPYFAVHKVKGSWYWPPTGIGESQVLPSLFGKVFRVLRPVDLLLGEVLPHYGHSVWMMGKAKKEGNHDSAERSFSILNAPLIKGMCYGWLTVFTLYAFHKGGILKTFWFYVKKLIN